MRCRRTLSAIVLSSLLAASAGAATSATLKPSTTDNDDSCDISLLPAATLLLPYFEVDPSSPQTVARTTIFTIQNTTAMPQIARVTLWTDWSYPMLTFNIFLTGYDIQAINLYDVFVRGMIAPIFPGTGGTSNKTRPGDLSLGNDQNPHFLPDAVTTCVNNPGGIDAALVKELQTAFTTGKVGAPGCAIVNRAGGVHANAIGYATIDVVANCNTTSPLGAGYFSQEILFDNVLTGDYQHIAPNPATGNYAGGNPLVHIRAIPEGGTAGAFAATALPYTFYDLYATGAALFRAYDRRQPLPSAFMPRYIEGGGGSFNTNLQIWREAMTPPTICPLSYASNASFGFGDVVRFDEHENPTYVSPCAILCPPGLPPFPSTSATPTSSSYFPGHSSSGDSGGWIFINGGSRAYGAVKRRGNQTWIVTSMFAEGRYSVEMDSLAIGNGCSPPAPLSSVAPIGPAGNPAP